MKLFEYRGTLDIIKIVFSGLVLSKRGCRIRMPPEFQIQRARGSRKKYHKKPK